MVWSNLSQFGQLFSDPLAWDIEAAYMGLQHRIVAKAKSWAARVPLKTCALQDQSAKKIAAEEYESGS